MNYLILVAAAAIALVVGSIWYHPKVMGTAWMKANGMDPNAEPTGNMAIILISAFVMAFFIAFCLQGMVLHQLGVFQLVAGYPEMEDPNSAVHQAVKTFLTTYGQNHMTFGHGMLHGVIAGLFFATPVLGINALFERRGWAYIGIHAGYWVITLGLMGGLICQFVRFPI